MFVRTAVLACLASVALGSYYGYVPTCIKDEEKCSGADSHPLVYKKPCCTKGYECVDVTGWADKKYQVKGKGKGWGSHCLKKTEYVATCAKEGMRCEGQKGYDTVALTKCCKGYVCSAQKGYWGKFCVPEKKYVAPPKKYVAPPKKVVVKKPVIEKKKYVPPPKKVVVKKPVIEKKKYVPPPKKPVVKKCYKEGERCVGAPGKPYVKYLGNDKWDGCCDGYYCTGKGKGYNAYGLYCEKPMKKKSMKKCYKEGERCIGAPGKPYVTYLGNDKWDGCCDGYTCTGTKKGYNAYGKYCVKPSYKTY